MEQYTAKRRGRIENLISFSADRQPSPEARKAGIIKRNAGEAIKKAFRDFSLLSFKELQKLNKKFDKGDYTMKGKDLTVAQVKCIQYILNKNLDLDFMNRGLGYETSKLDLTSNGNQIIGPIIYYPQGNNRKILESEEKDKEISSMD